ncbi:unnamed protein product [Clonostachys rosea f. rosea IK726]|uniref:Uncharacterized protein n=1 Tax=Clonostachys rosea f. rosea IK726 TaxID=1349383 RepID=A0ACA9UMB3_BIOOC|nr:unnamed protein product [Clonostachys rosea f. rosea IK726]
MAIVSLDPGAYVFTLQNLPQEIQALIYKFAVVEPPRWAKRHSLKCDLTPTRANFTEPPPFALTEAHINHRATKMSTTTRCSSCPIFWSQNTFCFLDAVEFIAAVKHNLRPQYREMIQSLSIISPDPSGAPIHVTVAGDRSKHMDDFWKTIKNCPSLRKLEVAYAYIQPTRKVLTHEHLDEMPEMLPNLSTISLSFLVPINRRSLGFNYPPPYYYDEWSQQALYVKCSRPLSLLRDKSWEENELDILYRNFHFNFRVHVSTASKVKFCGADIERLENYYGSWRIPKTLNAESNIRQLQLPTGETTVVKVYGLPLSVKARNTRLGHAKAEARKRERRPDGSRVAEHEAMKVAKQRKRQSRQGDMEKERYEYQELQLARGVRRLDLKAKENKDAKTSANNERESVRKGMKAAEENRRLERKRVANGRIA